MRWRMTLAVALQVIETKEKTKEEIQCNPYRASIGGELK